MRNRIIYFGLFLLIITGLTGCSTKSARSYYNNGQKCFMSGDYEDAAINYQKAIAKNSERADYYIEYGMTLIALEQYEESLVQFDYAYLDKDIKLIKENNKRVYRGKGIAYYYMLQYEKAIEQFDLALSIKELTDLDLDLQYYKGSSEEKFGYYEKAIDTYTDILVKNKEDEAIYNSRAYMYRKLGDFDKSLADYDKAISLKPNCFDYYFGKYYLMIEDKNDTGAKEVLEQASEIELQTKEDQYNLAVIHYFQDNFEDALTELKEGSENGFNAANYYLGKIHENKKDYSTAIYYYEIFIEKVKIDTPTVYNDIASCLIKTGDYKAALSYLEIGIAYQDDNMMKSLLQNEIVAYEKSGMFAEALDKLIVYKESYPEGSDVKKEEEFLKSRID